MPSTPTTQSAAISVEGHEVSSLQVVRFGVGAVAVIVFSFFCYSSLASVLDKLIRGRKLKRKPLHAQVAEVSAPLVRPATARLRPDVLLPALPSSACPPPSPLAALPAARTTGPAKATYRYSGQWLGGSQQQRKTPSRPNPPSVRRCQVPGFFVEDALKQKVSMETPSALLGLWQSALHLHQTADGVVGAHPDALPLEDRATSAGAQMSFRWVASSSIGAGFKFGLVHSLDVAPGPMCPVVSEARSPQSDAPLFQSGPATHTLGMPLHGIKYTRAPLVRCSNVNAKTNAPSGKTSPLRGVDKENAFGSPQAVRALV
ncbi:hypothetical protein C8R47DRAFT_1219319 [Mycena vitilis]|nr:hypothetical protein C8R47DRAFT_1219319 [Mycena vitilis]